MRVRETIEIKRSPEEIWAFVATTPMTRGGARRVKSVESVGPGRWQLRHKPVPLRPPVTLLVEQLKLDRPRRLTLREEDHAAVFAVEYQLEAAGLGTSFTQISDFEWKTLPQFLQKSFARGVRRDVRRQLQQLKRLLEAQ